MAANAHLWISLLLALLAPVGLLFTRWELRRVRSAIVEELVDTVFPAQREMPQLEMVLARYRAHSRDHTGNVKSGGIVKSGGNAASSRSRQALVMPVIGAGLFTLISFGGFLLLFLPIDQAMRSGLHLQPDLHPSLLWTFDNDATFSSENARLLAFQFMAVAGFAFLGAYLFQINYLIRATLNLELSALAFVRGALRLVIGMIVGVVLYRAMGALFGGAPSNFAGRGVAAVLGASFVAGYAPDSALGRLYRWLRVRLKRIDETAMAGARVVPVEIIDGIDSECAFRLQESNIHDVQNLAVVNPIILYAETPYGLFESFDWVLQAQLCLSVGPAAFQALKAHNIRTIFDLERAVLAEGAPDSYLVAIGAILFAKADATFLTQVGLPHLNPAIQANPPIVLNGEDLTNAAALVRHAVAIGGDDLHVHRLRALWTTLLRATTSELHRPWLFETEWLPGERRRETAEVSLDQISKLHRIAAAGADYRAAVATSAPQPHLDSLRDNCLTLVRDACLSGSSVRDRLRRLWDPSITHKRNDERDLEPFYQDVEFRQLLS